MNFDVRHGDCREVMATLAADSIDAIVSDPPYGLSFMGKGWDHGVPGVEFWTEALRVAKPGAHLLAFGGTRTFHRLACAIEDAGWDVRDCIMWVYGSGFPKSLDVSKAIDSVNGESNRLHRFTEWMRSTGLTAKRLNDATGTFMGSHYLTNGSQPAIPTFDLWTKLRPLCGEVPAWVEELVERVEAEREVVGEKSSGLSGGTGCTVGRFTDSRNERGLVDITAPATDAARAWSGWGTALKPAHEPIILARKPLAGTVAANVLTHGTGAINVDGCRVGSEATITRHTQKAHGSGDGWHPVSAGEVTVNAGRWPANFIHDGSEEVTQLLGDAARFFYCPKASREDREAGLREAGLREASVKMNNGNDAAGDPVSDRFTKIARNSHPTVKPTDLMRYLCRLVTPPNGLVLDPFTGSGSTGKAALLEGFSFLGIEREAEYVEIARARCAASDSTVTQTDLFAAEKCAS